MRHAPTLALCVSLLTSAATLHAEPSISSDWQEVLDEARGQTVYWHAWGGSTATNDFISWIGDRVESEAGVTLVQVKLSDTSEAVTRVLAERAAGQDEGGAVDLIWINGPNFAAMKDADLLYGPFASRLPNQELVAEGPAIETDFTVPTEGYESPWAMAQVVFMRDGVDLTTALPDMVALREWIVAHPGRFTFPQPPDFLGTTFLKQVLIGLTPDPAALAQPVTEADYAAITAPLWDWFDAVTPALWRAGRAYPATGPAQLQLMADNEIDLAISFSPGEASVAIADARLPPEVRTFVLDGGTLGNASFVAIPYNASAKAGAMVVANSLLSPEAQLRAQDPDVLGYGTVLDMDKLDAETRAAFAALDLGPATLSPAELGPALPEPHPSWAVRLAEDWQARYGVAQ